MIQDHKQTGKNIFNNNDWVNSNNYNVKLTNAKKIFNSQFNVNAPTNTNIDSCSNGLVINSKTNVDNYMKNLENIKGLNIATQNNVKAILLADQTLEDFDNYKRNKSRKEIMEINRLRLFGKVFKLLDEYKIIEKINSNIKTKIDSMVEEKNDITKNKLYAILYLIMERHLKEKNEEFKLTELLLTNKNTSTKKRYEIIMERIPETEESKLLKILYMTTIEKINYFDKKDSKINKIELELLIIEKMSNEELSLYFKEINEFYKIKDVNYRLKKIINNNKNNITRVHKKLNSLSGGVLKKLMGGSIIPQDSNIAPNKTLLLNEYNDLSAKMVTSNINDLAYYKNAIYIVGNSGYFSKYDLKTKQWTTPIITDNKYTNLNNIAISSLGLCIIVGDEGSIIYSSEKTDDNYPKTFVYKNENIDNNLLEVVINKDNKNIYIVGKGIKCLITNTSNITNNNFKNSIFNKIIVSNNTYFNIFQNINTSSEHKYCCLNLNKSNYFIDYLDKYNSTGGLKYINSLNLISLDNELDNSKSIHITNNNTHNMLIQHKNSNVIIQKLDFGSKTIGDKKTYTIDPNEKIEDYYINNTITGLITNKLNYYECKNGNIDTMSLRINNDKNISNSKIVQINPIINSYTNIYHFGSEGKILHYNINNKNKPDLKLKKQTDKTTIIPTLSGIDKLNNNIYTINNTEKNYTIETNTFTDWNDKTLRLEGNNNSLLIDKMKLLRFNYDIKNENENDNTELYSIINNNKVPLDINNPVLLSKKLHIKIDKNIKRNKNEFVSLALIINDKFKIWLKSENKNNIYEFNYTFSDLDDKNKYNLVKYKNGIFMKNYQLKTVNTNSTKISNILYEGINKEIDRNTNILYLDNIIKKDEYDLLIIPESNKSYIIYDKRQLELNETIKIKKEIKKINISIRNGALFENHIININFGDVKKIIELKDYELQYLLSILIDKAFEYLNNINKSDVTVDFLLKKYRLNKKNEVQEFLGLYTDINKREMIENKFINKLTDYERTEYLKKYFRKDIQQKK